MKLYIKKTFINQWKMYRMYSLYSFFPFTVYIEKREKIKKDEDVMKIFFFSHIFLL